MRELSLHLIDLLENSIRAGASMVTVTIAQDHARDRLEIVVEDNGPGLSVSFEEAVNPFYTTKHGKKTGMGLSLFKFRAEQAGGSLGLGPSELGGLKVTVGMQLSHIDRSPLGDIAATLSTLVCTTPELDLHCYLRSDHGDGSISVKQVAESLPPDKRQEFAIAALFHQQLQKALQRLEIME